MLRPAANGVGPRNDDPGAFRCTSLVVGCGVTEGRQRGFEPERQRGTQGVIAKARAVCSGLKQSHVFEGEAIENVAERGGFEPPVQETPHNRLATWPVQPLRHLSAMSRLGLWGPLRMGS